MDTPTATAPEAVENDISQRKPPPTPTPTPTEAAVPPPDTGKLGKVTLEHTTGGSARAGKLEKLKEFVFTKLIPCLLFLQEKAAKLYAILHPYLKVAFAKFEAFLQKYVDPYGRKEVAKMVSGVSMMFFGGFFITTIAVTEAVMQGGYEQIAKAVATLAQQTQHLREANKKDDKLDENNDGIPDVKQISKQELAARKMYLYLKCSDPEVLSEATQSLYTVFVCVVATLRLRFARAVSLGASIGDVLFKPVQKFVIPKVKPFVDEDVHKWLRPGGAYVCRLIGVSFAMYVQRLLSVFHTAIRGARLFTDGLTELSQRNGFSQWTDGKMDDIGAFALAGLGIYTQLFVFPFLPFIVKLLLFPATFTEWILTMFVSAAV